jgi:hypothetical protein
VDKSQAFWLVYIVAILAIAFLEWPYARRSGGWIVFFVLTGILGWQVFGAAIR